MSTTYGLASPLKRAAAVAILAGAAALAFLLGAQAVGGRPCTAPGVHAAGDLRSASGAVVGIVYVNGELSCPPETIARRITIEVQLQQVELVAALHLHERGSDRILVNLTSAGSWVEPNRLFRAVLGDGGEVSLIEVRRRVCSNESYLDVHTGSGASSDAWRANIESGTKC